MRKVSLFFLSAVCYLPGPAQSNNKNTQQAAIVGDHIISTSTEYETHPSFSPSGDTIYFLKCAPDISTSAIYVSYKKNGQWSAPILAPFSGKYFDADPFVTKDGNTLYFTSNRPVNKGDSLRPDTDIWKVEKTSNSFWGKPVHLGPLINSDQPEHYPTIADNGNMYFGSERAGGKGGSDIYCSKWTDEQFTAPVSLGGPVNSSDNEYEPYIAPDESYMIFMATIPAGLANADLYLTYSEQGKWSKPVKLPVPINSPSTEWAPKLSRNGQFLYFGSTRSRVPADEKSRGLSDIYVVPSTVVPWKKRSN